LLRITSFIVGTLLPNVSYKKQSSPAGIGRQCDFASGSFTEAEI
jgi:hypothetical protein